MQKIYIHHSNFYLLKQRLISINLSSIEDKLIPGDGEVRQLSQLDDQAEQHSTRHSALRHTFPRTKIIFLIYEVLY